MEDNEAILWAPIGVNIPYDEPENDIGFFWDSPYVSTGGVTYTVEEGFVENGQEELEDECND